MITEVKVNPNLIAPSQDFLKPDTIRYIFDCLDRNDLECLPPPPIVREDGVDNLVAIDGHNLIAVMLYMGQDVDVYVANSPNDMISEKSEADKARSDALRNKFHEAVVRRHQIETEGINSFADLIAKYKELFPK